ncbi:tyrosinase family protein (plasmid) [Azospirillum oryzae]|uniref:Tyrosinase family protein n=1 Tax=Azospirillum oryzae TaxID=286727 RepID=A0A6N1APE8_9PROT|nr:tyrosinase family protein [Azospirillum oryzae]KAA0585201.1 tyrosinase family protein [Azospirillum oryzae]QKS53675.1 tyrosinase family protein [Azospirillum oryzae]
MNFSRRDFLASTAAVAGASMLPFAPARAATAKYIRYSATSDEGKAMLRSYATAVQRMVNLPPDHPHNWFRNAFVHFMDCPHGNWWFYVWHRGYLGYFEETVRKYSDNPNFAFPYWDWTVLPQIPNEMFDGALTPVSEAFLPHTKDLKTFTAYIKPAMKKYWDTLNAAQRKQLDIRGYSSFDKLWDDVTGCSHGKCDPGNEAFAATDRARYLSRENPKLDDKTAKACSPHTVLTGLLPVDYYNADVTRSFTSSKTASHNVMPGGNTQFSVLEGQPHNLVHNCIGGVGPWDPGPYGNMTNFLSPVDPVFFLHHANMDRLWDVWTRKQQRLGLPILPTDKEELSQLSREPFLFFVRADGSYVLDGRAGDYLSTERFQYEYRHGFGDAESAQVAAANPSAQVKAPVRGTVAKGVGSVQLSAAPSSPVVMAVKVSRPAGTGASRNFDLLINAPAGVTKVAADSPYYGGTIGFFGPAMHGMADDATFTLPLPQAAHTAALAQSPTANAAAPAASATLEVRLVPTNGSPTTTAAVKAVSLQAL